MLEHDGRDLVDGFAEDEMSGRARPAADAVAEPDPRRRYSFGGADLQLALTEPQRHNASHGLARWAAWTLEEHTATRCRWSTG